MPSARVSIVFCLLVPCCSQQQIPAFTSEAIYQPREFTEALKSHGAIVFSSIEGLQEANDKALRSLSLCGMSSFEGFFQKHLLDGSNRWSLAGKGYGSIVPMEVEARCVGLEAALQPLRGIVGGIGSRFLQTMESEFGALGPARRSGGFRASVNQGEALEHFHLYSRGDNLGQDAVPLHTDSGAFLVVSKALTYNGNESNGNTHLETDSAFLMQSANGDAMHLKLQSDQALILMGEAMRSFLGAPVHVPPHAVNLRSAVKGSMRAWHGRMYLFHDNSRNDRGETARDLFLGLKQEPHKTQPGHKASEVWLRSLKEDCNTHEAVCWMQEPVCLETCPNGELQSCLLPDLSAGDCGPSAMNDQCGWRCPNATDKSEGSYFCDPASKTNMYMQGFTSVANKDRACVILFFPAWVLDTALKFVCACLGVACMGVLTQGLISLRMTVQKFTHKSKIADSVMFGVNVMIGWLMMLVAMTYSVELFASATLGLIIGNFCFGDLASTKILGSPCCNAVNDRSDISTAVFNVTGMTCNACVDTVRRAVLQCDGAVSCSVSLEKQNAVVQLRAPTTTDMIAESIGLVGFCAELAPSEPILHSVDADYAA